jgi:hypothetical protein
MKKQSTLLFALIICYGAALCQTPAITLTSSMPVGSTVYFTIEATNPEIQVDFGDGVLISKTLGTDFIPGNPDGYVIYWYHLSNNISGTLSGTRTVKVYGTGIITFFCYGYNNNKMRVDSSFKSIDVSNCTTLKWLDCSNSHFTTPDVSKNTALRYLVCTSSQITNLDVSPLTALEWLDCDKNKLTTLDVSKNTALSTLKCSDNLLTTLDVSKNTALSKLYCNANQLSALNVSAALYTLECKANKFTNLDITRCTDLHFLNCDANQLTTLDVSKNTSLWSLYCNANQLTALDVSKIDTALRALSCESNQLTTLDVSHNANLGSLFFGNNQLTAIDVSKNTLLQKLGCGGNPLSSLDVSTNAQLGTLSCDGIKSTSFSLDVSHNTNLVNLSCGGNKLTSLDVTKNPKLWDLFCSDNLLTSLDLSSNEEWLWRLDCHNNRLTSLDLSHNTTLYELYCNDNQLTSLDASKNPNLTMLFCWNNQLTFATLPTTVPINMWAPQSAVLIDKVIGTGTELDLSSQLAVNGNTTGYTWKTKSGATLLQGTDYSLTDGKTMFLKSQADSVYCVMTNAAFPYFSDEYVLKTTFAKVSINTDIDNANASGVKVYARNKTLYIVTPCNGQASVYDINGRLAMAKEITTGTNTIALPKEGIYLVRLTGSNTPVIKKVFAGN